MAGSNRKKQDRSNPRVGKTFYVTIPSVASFTGQE
jgi:hypothetical protein